MSTAPTIERPSEKKRPVERKESLFSKKNRKLVSDAFNDNNPITVQVLGICSALAVTTQLRTATVMAISVVFVVSCSNAVISALRTSIPNRIRMIVQLLVVSSLVVLVDQALKAIAYDVSRQLSVYIGLIITNCIIMGRLEGFAMANSPWPSLLDGLGNGFGYAAILLIVAFCRELFGAGSLYGIPVVPQLAYDLGYENNGMMLTSAASMFIIGVLVWVQRWRSRRLIDIS